jgi:S1-C subfamily serine protease
MFCKNCGQIIDVNNKFCKNCGQEIKIGRFSIFKARLGQWFKEHLKGIIIIIGVIIVVAIGSMSSENTSSPTTTQNVPAEQPSYKRVLTQEEISASVVNILCSNLAGTETMGGSGIIIAEDGGILTNHHVISEAAICLVTLPNPKSGAPNEIYTANPVTIPELSEQYDLAFLGITGAFIDDYGVSHGTFPKTFKSFDDSSFCSDYVPKLGEEIKIYGYPVTSGGYNLTITEGVISSFSDEGLILTSAKVDSGNSGGLAANKDGCFVGIPSAVKTGEYQNLGVLIPGSIIVEFSNQVISIYE